MTRIFERIVFSFALFVLSSVCFHAYANLPEEHFPVSPELRKQVDFWKRIYTEVSQSEGLIHDTDDLTIIYKKIAFGDLTPREKKKLIKSEKKSIEEGLRGIAKKKGENLTEAEAALWKLVGECEPKALLELSRNVRHQQGLRERYYEGLVRSYLYLDQIRAILKDAGVPEGLSYLPHVESSFNYLAYSKVGAAGIWQFMRPTARIYRLKVNYVIDERRDPIAATKAAARLLSDNFKKLGTWPLALTAYNHGSASMERAIREVGTNDISEIILKYQGRRFGFASKNFYATFIATSEISGEPEKYFPSFEKPAPETHSEVELPLALTTKQISKSTGLDLETLKKYNLAIRPSVFKSNMVIPKGYVLKVPKAEPAQLESLLAALSKKGAKEEVLLAQGPETPPSPKARPMLIPKLVPKAVAEPEEPETTSPETTPETLPPSPQPVSLVPLVLANAGSYKLDFQTLEKGLIEVTVEFDETLGHFAEWAQTSLTRIRNTNGMGPRSGLRYGQKLKIEIPESRQPNFIARRREHHMAIEEDFFRNFAVTGTQPYTVVRGDSIDGIVKKFDIPFWLIRKYQENSNRFEGRFELKPGEVLMIPQAEEKPGGESDSGTTSGT